MDIKFCDRCKRKIKEDEFTSTLEIEKCERFEDESMSNIPDRTFMVRRVCLNCINDFMNIIDYECNRYKLDTVVTVSKEAE